MKRTIAAAMLALMLAACQQNDLNNFAIDEGNGVNGEVETRRGRQLHPGDEVTVTNGGQTVTATVDLTEPDVPW